MHCPRTTMAPSPHVLGIFRMRSRILDRDGIGTGMYMTLCICTHMRRGILRVGTCEAFARLDCRLIKHSRHGTLNRGTSSCHLYPYPVPSHPLLHTQGGYVSILPPSPQVIVTCIRKNSIRGYQSNCTP